MENWKLFTPLKIKNRWVKNRLVLPPMCTEYADENGFVTDQLINYYKARAAGGIGFIQMENTAVVFPQGRSLGHHLGIDDDKFIPGLRQMARAIKEAGGEGLLTSCQINHAGAQANPAIAQGDTLGPSEFLAHPMYKQPCRAMTIGEIDWMVEKFGEAARRVVAAEYDCLALQFAHGYLVSNFLSPRFNKRTDEYGGSLENRARLGLRILRHCREVVGADMPIVVRMNAADFVEGGMTLDEARQVARWLVDDGADVIDVSCGVRGSYQQTADLTMAGPEAALKDMAQVIKQDLGPDVPVILCRRIQRPELAEEILQTTDLDMIAMGRALLADPDLANKTRDGHLEDVIPCIACNQACYDMMFLHEPVSCMVNPTVGREYTPEVAIVPTATPKHVMVVGGGPGGLEVARVMALRGHTVSLFEKDNRLGGMLHLAALPPRRQEFNRMIEWLEVQVTKNGVDIHLNTEVTPELIRQVNPDAVVVATGARFHSQRLKGFSPDNSRDQMTLLLGDQLQYDAGKDEWLVICPMSCCENKTYYGCDTVQHLAEQGKKVKFATFRSSPYETAGVYRRNHELRRFKELGIEVATGVSVRESVGDTARAWGQDKQAVVELSYDAVAMGVHFAPNMELFEAVQAIIPECYALGNCANRQFNAVDVMREATDLGRKI